MALLPFIRRRLSVLVAALVMLTSLVVAGSAPAQAAPRTAVVILLNFQPTPATPFTADDARTAVFTGPASVNVFEKEHSADAVSLTGKVQADGDVFGWYTITADTSVCDPDTWAAAANAAATDDGKDLTGYQHYLYVFPKVSACGWAGLADMPGTMSFMNGTLSVRVIAHELGHNLGEHHASALNCTDTSGARVAYSATCTQSEYGDPFDVMGASDRQSDAFRKISLGWMGSANSQTVTASGNYTLATASAFGSGVRSLRVPRGTGSSDYWYLELRSPAGLFDDFLASDPAVTGVTLRLATGYGIGVRTRLIDTQPATASFADAPLQPMRTFLDPVTGITVSTVSVIAGVATVQVDVDGSDAPAPAPAPATEPAPAPAPPSTWVVEPEPVRPLARLALRRGDARHGTLRVSFVSPRNAGRCSVRVGTGRWSPCRIVAGRVTLVRPVALDGTTLTVVVRLDSEIVIASRIRVPRIGGVTRQTRPLRLV